MLYVPCMCMCLFRCQNSFQNNGSNVRNIKGSYIYLYFTSVRKRKPFHRWTNEVNWNLQRQTMRLLVKITLLYYDMNIYLYYSLQSNWAPSNRCSQVRGPSRLVWHLQSISAKTRAALWPWTRPSGRDPWRSAKSSVQGGYSQGVRENWASRN
jgi:hypothetical protein